MKGQSGRRLTLDRVILLLTVMVPLMFVSVSGPAVTFLLPLKLGRLFPVETMNSFSRRGCFRRVTLVCLNIVSLTVIRVGTWSTSILSFILRLMVSVKTRVLSTIKPWVKGRDLLIKFRMIFIGSRKKLLSMLEIPRTIGSSRLVILMVRRSAC